MEPHGLEHARQELLSLGHACPANLGQPSFVADMDVQALLGLSRNVDHAAAGQRVDALAEDFPGPDKQARLLLHFTNGCIGRCLSRLDLASEEGPGRHSIVAAAEQYSSLAGDDRRPLARPADIPIGYRKTERA